MKLRPGRNLVRVSAALTLWSLLIFVWLPAAWLIPVAGTLALALIYQDYRLISHSIQHVTLQRSLPSVIGRSIKYYVSIRVTNSGRHAIQAQIRDVLPAESVPNVWITECELPADRQDEIVGEFQIPIRGMHDYGPLWLRLSGRYGMLDGQRCFDIADSIRVLPEGYWSQAELSKEQRAEVQLLDKLTRARIQGVGTEFESLSEFREGDDPRRIDWRATAKYQYPIVRRFQIERHRDVMILIDCGRLMGTDADRGTKLDCAVDASLMLSQVALQGGDRCGLGIFDDQVLGYLAPQAGPGSMRTIAECVYNVQSRWRESDFSLMFAALQSRHPKRSLVVVLSDIVDADTTHRFRASVARLAQRHVVLFAALRTPLLNRVSTSSVTTMVDGSKKAVAFRMLRDREKAIHSLTRTGVHVLDIEPAELTVPLINQFVGLRQRNLV